MTRLRFPFATLGVVALLAGCMVGPDYVKPTAPVPQTFKELMDWKPATPREAGSGEPWWSIYDDPVLDGLEKQIDVSNQNLKAAEAAYRQATALVAEAESQLFPTLAVTGSAQRSGPLGRPRNALAGGGRTSNQFAATGSGSWDLDVWGRIRRTIESQEAAAQASAADVAAARLSAQTTLATDYFELRAADEQKRLLDAAVIAYTESLRITQNQFAVGVAAQSDVISAKTQVEQTQAQAINVGIARAQFEHAIAVLVGKPPAELAIAATAPMPGRVPVVPTGLPSKLLERRPDIAAAERTMQQQNALIGVAVAAYYPDISLSASLGVASAALGNLFTASSALWAIGSNVSETVFDAGLREAQVAAARAVYEESIATYRQTVLTAFQQVEDDLAALRILADQAEVENAAVRDAREAERLMLNRYLAGNVPYTSVIIAQTTALTNEESALAILQNRLVSSVALVSALGGGWSTEQLPKSF